MKEPETRERDSNTLKNIVIHNLGLLKIFLSVYPNIFDTPASIIFFTQYV